MSPHLPLRRAFAALLLACCGAVFAYQQAGHFYTAFALAHTAPAALPDRERLLVAFCAQLPDMASDLDAVSVYQAAAMASPWKWFRWASADRIDGKELRRMVTMQQLLHGLTGGASKEVQKVALDSARALLEAAGAESPGAARDEALCAFGFSLHLLGDSAAHEQIDDAAKDPKDRRMYVTGRGHAADWNDPDHVFCSRYVESMASRARSCQFDEDPRFRFESWHALWKRIGAFMDELFKLPQQDREPLVRALRTVGRDAAPVNQWNEKRMRFTLGHGLDQQVDKLSDFIDRHEKEERPCEQVLQDAANESLAPFVRGQAPSCAKVWSRYQSVVRTNFLKAPKEVRKELDTKPDFERDVYCTTPLAGQDC